MITIGTRPFERIPGTSSGPSARAMKLLALLALLGLSCMPALAEQSWKPLTYSADNPALDTNPLRGFVPFGLGQAASTFPHSMVWVPLPLKPIMTGPSSFDWTSIENALNQVSSRGDQAILHFYVDFPGQHSALPQFLVDEGLKTYPYDDADNDGKSVCPDYRDQRLVQAFRSFLTALAAKYDGDPRVAFLVPGLYGFWGEWQVKSHTDWEMYQFDKDAIVETLATSFHKTPVQLRHAYDSSSREMMKNFGLHDASFIAMTLGNKPFDFWFQVKQAHMEEFWKTHPMGGELAPGVLKNTGTFTATPNDKGKAALETIRTTHSTWQTASNFFESKGLPPTLIPEQVMTALRLMGYQLTVSQVSLTHAADGTMDVGVRIANRGIAPFYGTWPTEMAVIDQQGKMVSRTTEQWPLQAILPGEQKEFHARLQTSGGGSSMRLILRVVPPLPNGHPLRFANTTQDAAMPGWLTLANSLDP